MLGIHTGKSKFLEKQKPCKFIHDAIKRDIEDLQTNAVQIFTHGPRNMRKTNYDAEKINKFCENNDVYLTIHASYVLDGLIWHAIEDISSGNDELVEKGRSAVKHLLDQVKTSINLNNAPVVLHLPRKPIKEMIEALKLIGRVLEKYKTAVILFENVPCTNVKAHYSSPANINKLTKTISKYIPSDNWGLCIDTSHIWSCGVDLTKYEDQEKWFSDLTELSRKKIRQFHLNGSNRATFNKNRDEHYVVLTESDDMYKFDQKNGKKSEFKKMGVFSVCKFARKYNVPVICEIHSSDKASEKEVLNSLAYLKEMLF
jgi:endonuclease IV